MKNIIYAVSSGEYSSYHIVGVFSTKEKAEAFRDWQKTFDKSYDGIHDFIQEFELDIMSLQSRFNWKPFRITMKRDGTIKHISLYHEEHTDASNLELEDWGGYGMVLHGIVWAKDLEHTAKITNERRAKLIALGQWKTN